MTVGTATALSRCSAQNNGDDRQRFHEDQTYQNFYRMTESHVALR